MHRWKYAGIHKHIFTYDKTDGYLSCSCRMMGTRVSLEQAIPSTERHVRNLERVMGSLVLQDLSR